MKASYSPTGRHSSRCSYCMKQKRHSLAAHKTMIEIEKDLRADTKRIQQGRGVGLCIVVYSIK